MAAMFMVPEDRMTRVEHQSSRSNHLTPELILERVRKMGPIGLDPASCKGNPTKATTFYTPKEDGLKQPWTGHGLVFVNSPYGRKRGLRCQEWVYKAIREAYPEHKQIRTPKGAGRHKDGAEIVMLLPARTDTQWFQALWRSATCFCFVKGRITFVGENNGAPFPSVLAYLGPDPKRFSEAFEDLGFITPWRIC